MIQKRIINILILFSFFLCFFCLKHIIADNSGMLLSFFTIIVVVIHCKTKFDYKQWLLSAMNLLKIATDNLAGFYVRVKWKQGSSGICILRNNLDTHPLPDSMAALHLIKADLNLIFKWHSSKGFILCSKKALWLHDSQYGGCLGHSTIDLTCKKMVFYDNFHIILTKAADLSLDVALCFDHMIESCQNLSCQQHGANLKYLKLHAQTHLKFHYHVKHAHSISMEFNSFSDQHPWYGAGQGTSNAFPCCIIQVDRMTLPMTHRPSPWSSNHQTTATASTKAFIHLWMTPTFQQPPQPNPQLTPYQLHNATSITGTTFSKSAGSSSTPKNVYWCISHGNTTRASQPYPRSYPQLPQSSMQPYTTRTPNPSIGSSPLSPPIPQQPDNDQWCWAVHTKQYPIHPTSTEMSANLPWSPNSL